MGLCIRIILALVVVGGAGASWEDADQSLERYYKDMQDGFSDTASEVLSPRWQQSLMAADAVDISASDWNNRIRNAVIKISSKIPEVGAVVSILVGFLWPEDKVDVFESLKADIQNLVKKELLPYELNLHQSEIHALKDLIERYNAAQINEKAYFLNNWIVQADKLSVIFRESTNNIHLIPAQVTLALLHLTGLRERLQFGKKLYHEDNTEQWKKDLEDMYKTYIVDFLPDIFQKWKVWRANQVQINGWVSWYPIPIPPWLSFTAHATVMDTVTGETKHFSNGFHDSSTLFESICQDHKSRMCNDAFADMAGCISTTFVFDKLLPDNEKNFPKYDKNVFGRIFKGPYAQALCYDDSSDYSPRAHPDQYDYSPNSGPLTKVIIREWNSIDAMQFIYANFEGRLVGNPSGGLRHDIDVRDRPINGLRMGFSNGLLTYVQINYYDGTKSDTYGNRGGWQCREATAKGPATYKVSSWSYALNQGPSQTYGPGVIQLEYKPQIE